MIKIEVQGRNLVPAKAEIGVQQDNNAEEIMFVFLNKIKSIPLYNYTVTIQVRTSTGKIFEDVIPASGVYAITRSLTTLGNTLTYALKFQSGDVIYGTTNATLTIAGRVDAEKQRIEEVDPSELEALQQQIDTRVEQIEERITDGLDEIVAISIQSKVDVHDSSTMTHADIRQMIEEVGEGIPEQILDSVDGHNLEAEAHLDIRTLIAELDARVTALEGE